MTKEQDEIKELKLEKRRLDRLFRMIDSLPQPNPEEETITVRLQDIRRKRPKTYRKRRIQYEYDGMTFKRGIYEKKPKNKYIVKLPEGF